LFGAPIWVNFVVLFITLFLLGLMEGLQVALVEIFKLPLEEYTNSHGRKLSQAAMPSNCSSVRAPSLPPPQTRRSPHSHFICLLLDLVLPSLCAVSPVVFYLPPRVSYPGTLQRPDLTPGPAVQGPMRQAVWY